MSASCVTGYIGVPCILCHQLTFDMTGPQRCTFYGAVPRTFHYYHSGPTFGCGYKTAALLARLVTREVCAPSHHHHNRPDLPFQTNSRLFLWRLLSGITNFPLLFIAFFLSILISFRVSVFVLCVYRKYSRTINFTIFTIITCPFTVHRQLVFITVCACLPCVKSVPAS